MSKLQSSIAPGPLFRPFLTQNAANVARERFYEGRVVPYVLVERGKRDNTFVLCSAAAELSVESPSSLFSSSSSSSGVTGLDDGHGHDRVPRGNSRDGRCDLPRGAQRPTPWRRSAPRSRGSRGANATPPRCASVPRRALARAARRGARDRGRCRGVHGAPAPARGGTCRGRRARGAGFHAIGAHRGTGRRARGVRRGAAARGVRVVGAVPWRAPARRGRGARRPRRHHVTGGDNARPRRSRNP